MKNKCINLGMLQGDKWDKLHDESRRVYSDEGASPSLVCTGGGNHEIKIAECVGGISENKWGGNNIISKIELIKVILLWLVVQICREGVIII